MIESDNNTMTEEQNAFINQLEDAEQAEQFDPEEAERLEHEQAEQELMNNEGAQLSAFIGLSAIETAIKGFVHPRFAFSEESKAYALANMAPLLVKYGATVPAWLMQYREEINAANAAAKLFMEGSATIKRLKAEDAKNAETGKSATDPEGVQ